MEKLRMTSPDLTDKNIDMLAKLFPSVIIETIDADGNPKNAIDFDLLRQELSNHVVEGPQERYRLDWPGKRAAAFAANAPIAKTLRPVREESVDFDTTKNLFIEGDNLDALKLLQESYLGKVKLIYIDPPYNTGNDFVYNDDFAETAEDYLLRSGQTDDSGARLSANPESNGRFHSDWLSMMYPRLKLARNLLSDDGIIAISIDDNEVAALRTVGDEVFGSSAFIGALTWRRRPTPDSRNYSRLSVDHEYVLLYGRSNFARLKGRGIDESKYKNPDNDPRGFWTSENLTGLASADQRPNLHYDLVNPATGLVYPPSPSRGWSKGRESMDRLIAESRILWPASPDGRPREKKFLSELKSAVTGFSTWLTSGEIGYNYTATREVRDLLGGKLFDFPKPVSLVKTLCDQVTEHDDIVLDFFAGSGSTAHAVMSANASDESARRFILVQLGESVEAGSEAAKAGYRSIAELSRERVRRAGQLVIQQAGMAGDGIDVGFRTLKVDTTNMADVLRVPDETDQLALTELEGSVKPDRSGEDLLFQVLLDWGLELTMPISVEQLDGYEVFVVEDGALIACFDSDVSPELMRTIAKRAPLRVVFRDSGFVSDDARINTEQIFRELSPATDVKAI
ncbi:site-specific DNA-methyltransferase [Rhodococcus erythropolis]|uniref:Site-specific DNA-methyltransferase n=1 Tax=Rhodococcus erythropolis TaxID=1833 RepID=A0A5N5E7T2_RHOER|nr:site-specific DNA-methyltransferase [Rhodococcus erythropolis]